LSATVSLLDCVGTLHFDIEKVSSIKQYYTVTAVMSQTDEFKEIAKVLAQMYAKPDAGT
jgi:hypothetical protein